MSVFNKVIEAHQDAKTKAEHAAAGAVAARSEAETAFALHFQTQINDVAIPIFEKFAADADAHGFSATTEHTQDGKRNPIYSVRLILEKGARLGANPSNEVAYTLRGITAEQKVEHSAYFDQRPGKNGTNKSSYGAQSINATVLERELGEFLSSALKARTA